MVSCTSFCIRSRLAARRIAAAEARAAALQIKHKPKKNEEGAKDKKKKKKKKKHKKKSGAAGSRVDMSRLATSAKEPLLDEAESALFAGLPPIKVSAHAKDAPE